MNHINVNYYHFDFRSLSFVLEVFSFLRFGFVSSCQKFTKCNSTNSKFTHIAFAINIVVGIQLRLVFNVIISFKSQQSLVSKFFACFFINIFHGFAENHISC